MWRDIVKIVFDPNGDCDVRFVLKYVAKVMATMAGLRYSRRMINSFKGNFFKGGTNYGS